MLAIARKFDVAGRAERNRSLGRAGEERVIAHEQTTLTGAGRFDLAFELHPPLDAHITLFATSFEARFR